MRCCFLFAVLVSNSSKLAANSDTDSPKLLNPSNNNSTTGERSEIATNQTEEKSNEGRIEETFPAPSMGFTEMVEAAKKFVKQYLSVDQWLNMKKLLRVIKEIGGARRDLHRAITIYLGRVLSAEKRREIEDRKEELERTFSGSFSL